MSKHKLNTRAAGVVAIAVGCSRILGLAREMIFAALFRPELLGMFFQAFKFSNLLRDLFAEGALSMAFITVFSQKIEREGPQAAWRLAAKVATLTAVFMSAVTLLCIVFAGPLIEYVIAPGFSQENKETTILLTRIMYPFILLVSLAALAMGMLNSRNVFGIPAMASSFFNIGSIVGGVAIGWWIDPAFGRDALTGLAIGTLIGGFLQLAIQFPSLWKVGFRFRPDFAWNDSDLKRMLILMTPAVIAASAVQVNVMVNAIFASFLGTAAVAWLQYAFRLMQLPLGMFGVAVATITTPVVSRISATGDLGSVSSTLGRAMRLALFLTVPAATGLYLLADPILSLLYERGETTAFDVAQAAGALKMYVIGLASYSMIKVVTPAFYAIDKKWLPMTVSFLSIGLNLGLNYWFIFHLGLGHEGLALAVSISATANFLCLFLLLSRETHGLEAGRLLLAIARTGLAAAALGAVAWFGAEWGARWIDAPHFLTRLASLLALIGIAGGTYLLVCFALRVPEVHDALGVVRRKLGR